MKVCMRQRCSLQLWKAACERNGNRNDRSRTGASQILKKDRRSAARSEHIQSQGSAVLARSPRVVGEEITRKRTGDAELLRKRC